MDYFAKFKTQGGLEFMDNRETGDIERVDTLETSNIDEWGFINGKFGRTSVFTVHGLPQHFFFGNKITATDALYGYTIGLFDCRFGVWRDANGIYYISRKIPKDYESFPVFALTRDDATPDYEVVRISSPRIKSLIQAYIHGDMCFDNSLTREKFMSVFSMFELS